MAFRTSTSLAVEYERLKALARHLRSQCVRHKTATDLPTIVNELLPLLISTSAAFNTVPAEMADFAREQERDVSYDVAGEFLAMAAAVDDARVTLVAGMPKDTEGYILDRQMDGQGNVTNWALTAEQSTALNTKLDAIIATIGA